MMNLSLIIPAYNEGKQVADTVLAMNEMLQKYTDEFEIIVVDDGSMDNSCQLSTEIPCSVIRHPINCGYGNSLRSGIHAAKYDWILICDADGSYDPQDLSGLVNEADKYDMTIGARKGSAYYGGGFKRIGRFLQIFVAQFATGTRIPDVNSGYRLMKKSDVVPLFDLVCCGFSFTTSITIAMILMQKKVRFVPIRYHERVGKSHVRIVRDSLRSLQIITQCILRFNPIKVFLGFALLETSFGSLLSLLLYFTGIGFTTSVLVFSFWIAIAFLTVAIGFMTYAVQNSTGKSFPLDLGMNPQQENIRKFDYE